MTLPNSHSSNAWLRTVRRLGGMQAPTEMCGLKWVDEVVRKQGIRAVRTTRDDSPFTYSLYLSAAVTSHFQLSSDNG